MSSSLLQRLSLMAGVTLTEAQQQQPDRKSTQVKTLSEAAKQIGWYVTNADDKEVAGPLSLPEARSKAKELGGDAKGFDVSYTSDYDSKRASVQEGKESARDEKVAAHNKAVAGGYTSAMRKIAAKDPAVCTTAPAGYTFNVRHKLIKKEIKEATGSNKVFDDISTWKAACKKAGLEVYSQGAADGKYTAKKDGEVYGRFNTEYGDGWIHSSAMKEAADYDDEGNVIPEGPLPQGLAEIARQLGFQTLDTRNSDSLDFKEVSVGGVKAALLAAYNLGKSQATAQATPAEQQPQSGGLPVPQGRTPADHQQAGPVGIAR